MHCFCNQKSPVKGDSRKGRKCHSQGADIQIYAGNQEGWFVAERGEGTLTDPPRGLAFILPLSKMLINSLEGCQAWGFRLSCILIWSLFPSQVDRLKEQNMDNSSSYRQGQKCKYQDLENVKLFSVFVYIIDSSRHCHWSHLQSFYLLRMPSSDLSVSTRGWASTRSSQRQHGDLQPTVHN